MKPFLTIKRTDLECEMIIFMSCLIPFHDTPGIQKKGLEIPRPRVILHTS